MAWAREKAADGSFTAALDEMLSGPDQRLKADLIKWATSYVEGLPIARNLTLRAPANEQVLIEIWEKRRRLAELPPAPVVPEIPSPEKEWSTEFDPSAPTSGPPPTPPPPPPPTSGPPSGVVQTGFGTGKIPRTMPMFTSRGVFDVIVSDDDEPC